MSPVALQEAPVQGQVLCIYFSLMILYPLFTSHVHIRMIGGVDPSSPAGPEYGNERDMLLGNDDLPLEEEDGEELFGDNYERCCLEYLSPWQ